VKNFPNFLNRFVDLETHVLKAKGKKMENTHEEWLDSAQDQYISVEQHTHLSSDQMGPCNPIGRPFKVKLAETDVVQGEMPDLRRGRDR
jgi:hypothetical protein